MTATCLKHVHHCVASPVRLTTVCKHLESDENSCWTFGGGMLSYSCLTKDFSCSAVLGHLFCILHFVIHKMFSTTEKSEPKAS